jgi:hypothetical protein
MFDGRVRRKVESKAMSAVVTQMRASAVRSDVGAKVAEAVSLRDAKRIEEIVREVSWAPESVEKRTEAIVSIVGHHFALNSVVVGAVHLLESLDPGVAGKLARKILSDPPSDEREMVRAAAIRALVESGTLDQEDLHHVARSINSNLSHVRFACQRALRGLKGANRKALEQLVASSQDPGMEPLKLFVRALEPEARQQAEIAEPLTVPARPRTVPAKPSAEKLAARRALKGAAAARRIADERIKRIQEVSERKAKEARSEPTGSRAVKPATPTGEAVSGPNARVEVQDGGPAGLADNEALSRLSALRDPALASLALDGLRTMMTLAVKPDEFAAAAAEVAHRFGIDRARAHADRTLWFLSHPDFCGHEGLLELSRALFS